jgi:hypothetical protein
MRYKPCHAALLGLFLAAPVVGCGGDKGSEPKAVNVKDDPRIQRNGNGGPTNTTTTPKKMPPKFD